MKIKLLSAKTMQRIGAAEAKARKVQQAAEEVARNGQEAADVVKYVKRELPFVREQIAKKLLKATAPHGEVQYSFGTSLGASEVRRIIREELVEKGYAVRIEYSPGEAGRRAYDESDIPATYEMYIRW